MEVESAYSYMETIIPSSITEKDLDIIASMHISPCIADAKLRKPQTQFRFFRDKVKLFYEFDKDSIILERNDDEKITGILIYTYNESEFNRFSGPKHLGFYIRTLKVLLGFYGCKLLKFFSAALSMLGKNNDPNVPTAERYGKIWVLIVMKEYRRQGIADKLLNQCIDTMKNRGEKLLRVTVAKNNAPALSAYKKLGFEIIGNCKESSGDSYVMQLEL